MWDVVVDVLTILMLRDIAIALVRIGKTKEEKKP